MKKLKIFGCIVVIAMVMASFLLVNNSNQEHIGDLSMSNIEALHASAGEMSCDQSNDKECTITAPSGHVGKSTGKLWATW
jgi:hypothetical protein